MSNQNAKLWYLASFLLSFFLLTPLFAVDYNRSAPVRKSAPIMSPKAKQLAPLIQTGDLPDLQPNSITFSPGKPRPGDTVTVWVQVWNTGKVDSTPAMVSLRLRATYPPQGSNPPVYTASTSIPAVKPNMAKVATFTVTMNGATRGQWKAETVVDTNNNVIEANETNNAMHQLFQVL
ncbi:MAG: CARDB domain-containing protein [Sedimenticola sp.]